MLLLALDTATSAITVAVHDGLSVVAEEAVIDPRRHTEALAPAVQRVLRRADAAPDLVTHVAVGTGPGPFTGLRVGLVTATTMGHALGIPVHGVCSLDALAHQVARGRDGEFLVATDARRKEVYWAGYRAEGGAATRVGEPAVVIPAALAADLRHRPTAGRGPLLYLDLFPDPIAPQDVSAGSLAEVAVAELARGPAVAPTPRYLRRPDAQAPGAPKTTLATGASR